MPRIRAAAPLSLLLCLASSPAPPAREVLAVLSSAPGPYQAAYDGFARAFGREVAHVRLPMRLPAAASRARVVVAFGREAAVQSFPKNAIVIACLAPGLSAREARLRSFVHLALRPAPENLLSALRRLQPGLKRLAVLSHALGRERFLVDLKAAGDAIGVEIVAVAVNGPEGVPDALRSVLPIKADALWLAPDPALVTPKAFQTILNFSWDNRIPFYAPTRSLVAAGAAAAVSAGPEETGRQAAELARRALAGESLPELVYPERAKLTVNLTSARKAGLVIAPGTLGKDDEVLP